MTKLLVLALLSMQPMSGYEIKGMLEQSDSQRWAGALPGSIYNALKKLEAAGYVEVATIENQGHRQKAIYKITKAGQQYQAQLILEALGDPKVNYPTSLYSGIGLAHQLPKDEAVQALKDHKAKLQKEIIEVKQGLIAKENAMQGEIPALSKVVFDHMFETIESQIRLIEQTITIIEKQ
ncbi:PadR family transcriptional regulator [Enterococcus sp. AZ109]|uniref:PadR family transcriptional regulator n=1 Tax=Enterococcus sp. AZ109 TaxID=2774634 RepID=UPI003F260BB9